MGILRLALALSVVMSHGLTTLFGVRLFDGGGAVWTFFAISGFLITIALSRKYDSGSHNLHHFYWNRFIRLYPAYWFWLLVSILVYVSLPSNLLSYQRFVVGGSWQATGFWKDYFLTSNMVTIAIATTANLSGFFADSLLSLGLDKTTGALIANPDQTAPIWAMGFVFLGQYWSIGVELCFYAIAPFIFKSLVRIGFVFFLASSGTLETAWIASGTALHAHPAIVYLLAPKFIWMFMVGAVLAHVYIALFPRIDARKLWKPSALLIAMYGYLAWRGTDLFPIGNFPWWLFVLLTACLPWLFEFTGKNKYDKFAGELSYPVYINHFIIIQFLGSVLPPHGFVFAGVSLSFAVATTLLIERPIRRLKYGSNRKNIENSNMTN